jgi:hypothetical protein
VLLPVLLAVLTMGVRAVDVGTHLPVLAEGPGAVIHDSAWEDNGISFSFAITADMRVFSGPGQYDTSQYFRGACESLAAQGGGDFMVSPGDIDPPSDVSWTIKSTLGESYTWYPGVGNHELPGAGYESSHGATMDWLRSYAYGTVNPGPSGCPETTYSFDHGNAHFVMLNEYCDASGDTATSGDVPDHVYDWLAEDLEGTDRTHVFVFGHEPAYPQPDADNGRIRHVGDSLDQYPANRDRFWSLLGQHGVDAYVCGHTHNHSLVNLDGVWQLDAGHARGLGDTGARSTFVLVRVEGDYVTYEAYRDDANGGPYVLRNQTKCGLPGDFDCDCTVEVDDVYEVASRWRAVEGTETYNPRYDRDDDGDIDVVDVMRVVACWGAICPEGASEE